MGRYLLVRLFQSIITVLIFLAIIFVLVRLTGDPVLQFMAPDAMPADYDRLRTWLGLDQPMYVQYVLYIKNAVTGDLGDSIFTKRAVLDSLKEALPNSLSLALVSAAMAFLLAIPLGVLAATHKGTLADTAARGIAGLGQSLPSFWVGMLLIQFFAVQWGWLPASGTGDLKNYILPGATLGLFLMAGPLRLLRSSMLEVSEADFIKLARIKGTSETVITWKHALRNALLPVLSFSGMYVAILITGSITTEVVFAWPGIGRLAYRAILNHDFPLIQGVVLAMAFVVVVTSLLIDLLYAYVDPRIRLKA